MLHHQLLVEILAFTPNLWVPAALIRRAGNSENSHISSLGHSPGPTHYTVSSHTSLLRAAREDWAGGVSAGRQGKGVELAEDEMDLGPVPRCRPDTKHYIALYQLTVFVVACYTVC
ncbi:hypothetical protein DPEC_G00164750 [Dallia pectoralis]|uniref:Uncharacterized protein n=1 Tax=Dallia pectoralis TaxID=75939 RepID=A0ACC2GHN8_DALPE|nr:hypothetical protein DPEC_G00164750 [Dallia pectoralis]